jgi:hypothetical protein
MQLFSVNPTTNLYADINRGISPIIFSLTW